jgi:CRP-like cAMP-binding protein
MSREQLTNKHFNSYKEGLDLEFLRAYCMEHGERRVMERGETLEEAGEPAQWVAYVERGCFKYMVHNDEEGKDYCTGFAFEGEFVADFPYCLDGDVSEVSIEADMPCEVRVIKGSELQRMFDEEPEKMRVGWQIMRNLFKMVYARDLDHYRYTARGRYRQLLDRCPQVVQMLSLKDIASFLNVTPTYLSKIRKAMTFEAE